MDDLKSCPFCGWQPERVLCDDAYSHKVNYFVRCDPCDLVLEFHGSPKEAVTQWNRRAPNEARSLALEECAKIAESIRDKYPEPTERDYGAADAGIRIAKAIRALGKDES